MNRHVTAAKTPTGGKQRGRKKFSVQTRTIRELEFFYEHQTNRLEDWKINHHDKWVKT